MSTKKDIMAKVRVKYYKPINAWPDYQLRIFKLGKSIKWRGKVHEVPGKEGVEVTPLPCEDATWALYHPKTIKKQEMQNEMYSKM